MRRMRLSALLPILLLVASCGSSSVLKSPDLTPQLLKAQSEVDRRLDCPPPPPALTTCSSGEPMTRSVVGGALTFTCAPPLYVTQAIEGLKPMKDVAANAGKWAMDETNLRGQMLEWFTATHACTGAQTDAATHG